MRRLPRHGRLRAQRRTQRDCRSAVRRDGRRGCGARRRGRTWSNLAEERESPVWIRLRREAPPRPHAAGGRGRRRGARTIAHPITQAAPTVTSTHPHKHARRYCECDAATPTAGPRAATIPLHATRSASTSCQSRAATTRRPRAPRAPSPAAHGAPQSTPPAAARRGATATAAGRRRRRRVDWDETLAQALQGISDADGGDTPPTSPQLWAIAYATAPPPPPSSSQAAARLRAAAAAATRPARASRRERTRRRRRRRATTAGSWRR